MLDQKKKKDTQEKEEKNSSLKCLAKRRHGINMLPARNNTKRTNVHLPERPKAEQKAVVMHIQESRISFKAS
jgi:hypothetical protein